MQPESKDLAGEELITDPQGAELFHVGMTSWFEIQKRPGFPTPIWLGPRRKRHVRRELLAWALSQRERVAQ